MDKYQIITIATSISVSIGSLIISLLTTYLNNKHQRKNKILDIVYEKKYNTYKKLFELYATYNITQEYDKTELTEVITQCLMIANRESSYYLDNLLRNMNKSETEKRIMPFLMSDDFHNSVESLRKELDLK